MDAATGRAFPAIDELRLVRDDRCCWAAAKWACKAAVAGPEEEDDDNAGSACTPCSFCGGTVPFAKACSMAGLACCKARAKIAFIAVAFIAAAAAAVLLVFVARLCCCTGA